jgi:hypothetical protein
VQQQKYLELILGEVHCRDVRPVCSPAVVELFGHRSRALAKVKMKLYVLMTRKEADTSNLSSLVSSIRTRLRASFLPAADDYIDSADGTDGEGCEASVRQQQAQQEQQRQRQELIARERVDALLDALHSRHLLLDLSKEEMDDGMRRYV